MQKKIEKIVKEISGDLGLPVGVVKAIVESQFYCAREATKQGEAGEPSTFLNIRFKHLGILVVKPGRLKKLSEYARINTEESMDRS